MSSLASLKPLSQKKATVSVIKPEIFPQQEYSQDAVVERWKSSADFNEKPEDSGTIGRLYKCCIAFYKSLLKVLVSFEQNDWWDASQRISEREIDILQSQCHLICLWGDDFGIFEGDLDRRLGRSPDLRLTTLSLLISIGEALISQCLDYRSLGHG